MLVFQPTLPARGATGIALPCAAFVLISTHAPRTGSDIDGEDYTQVIAISTHAPRTGSDVHHLHRVKRIVISTHAPRTGSDGREPNIKEERIIFQPTLPARGATGRGYNSCELVFISTHAPRTGSDARHWQDLRFYQNFNPRSPHGERQEAINNNTLVMQFQPTLPARGATRL